MRILDASERFLYADLVPINVTLGYATEPMALCVIVPNFCFQQPFPYEQPLPQ